MKVLYSSRDGLEKSYVLFVATPEKCQVDMDITRHVGMAHIYYRNHWGVVERYVLPLDIYSSEVEDEYNIAFALLNQHRGTFSQDLVMEFVLRFKYGFKSVKVLERDPIILPSAAQASSQGATCQSS